MTPAPFFVLCPALLLTLSVAVLQEPSPPPPSSPSAPTSSEQPRDPSHAWPLEPARAPEPQTFLLREGTPIKLKLLHALNSKTVVVDDPLNFAVAEDVVMGGKTIVKAGAPAIGRVRQAKAARTLGRGAQLSLELQYLKVGRTRVALRGSQTQSGENKKGETVGLTVVFGLSGLLKHGSEIEVKPGSIISAYIDRDTDVPLLSLAEPGPNP
jgi:hypothetical protein